MGRRFVALGFTLVELLVVIVIVSVAAGMVSLSVAPSEERLLAMETDRLAALFRLAQTEARVSGRPLTWEADEAGYRFHVGNAPRSREPGDPLRHREWPFRVVYVDSRPLVFGAEPLLPPAEIRIKTSQRELVLALDAFGNLTRLQ